MAVACKKIDVDPPNLNICRDALHILVNKCNGDPNGRNLYPTPIKELVFVKTYFDSLSTN